MHEMPRKLLDRLEGDGLKHREMPAIIIASMSSALLLGLSLSLVSLKAGIDLRRETQIRAQIFRASPKQDARIACDPRLHTRAHQNKHLIHRHSQSFHQSALRTRLGKHVVHRGGAATLSCLEGATDSPCGPRRLVSIGPEICIGPGYHRCYRIRQRAGLGRRSVRDVI
jgi:hypothetical protein